MFLILIVLTAVMLLAGMFSPRIGLFFAVPAKQTRPRVVGFWLLVGMALLWLFSINHNLQMGSPTEKGMLIFAGLLVAGVMVAIYRLRL
jgi:hypothetical protein